MSTYTVTDPTLPSQVAVIGTFDTKQDAELAALDYARKHAPMEQPTAEPKDPVIAAIFLRLHITEDPT